MLKKFPSSLLFLIIITSLFFNKAFSQDPEWIYFTSGSHIQATAIEGDDYIWIGSYGGGLTRLNAITGEMNFYQKQNSDLLIILFVQF